jgi:uncharacterized membrane protein
MAVNERAPFIFGPGLTIGVGLGGLLDGILLHQILGWHHVVSAPDSDVRANDVADGLFSAGAWLVVVAGVLWLYARLRLAPTPAAWPRLDRGPRPWRVLLGSMLAGWGLFTVVEALVNHHLLGLHHVRPGTDQLTWDLGLLVLGVLIAGAGLLATRPRGALPAS